MDDKGLIARFMTRLLRDAQVWIVVLSLSFLGFIVIKRSGLLP